MFVQFSNILFWLQGGLLLFNPSQYSILYWVWFYSTKYMVLSSREILLDFISSSIISCSSFNWQRRPSVHWCIHIQVILFIKSVSIYSTQTLPTLQNCLLRNICTKIRNNFLQQSVKVFILQISWYVVTCLPSSVLTQTPRHLCCNPWSCKSIDSSSFSKCLYSIVVVVGKFKVKQ